MLSGVAVGCLTFAVSKVLPLQYTSEGEILVADNESKPLDSADAATAAVSTEVDVLESRDLVEQVTRELKLVGTPGLVPKMRLPAALLESVRIAAGWAVSAKRFLDDRPDQGSTAIDETEAYVDYVRKHLHAKTKEHSRVITLSFEAGDPQIAASVVNGIMALYMSSEAAGRDKHRIELNRWIAQQSAAKKQEVDAAAQVAMAFVRQHYLPEIQGTSEAALRLSKHQDQLAAVRQELARQQAAVNTIAHGGSIAGAEETLESRTIQSLKMSEEGLTEKINSLTPSDPRRGLYQVELEGVRSQIKTEGALILSSLTRKAEITRAQVQVLENEIQRDSAEVQETSANTAALKNLTLEVDAKRQIYSNFLIQAEQASLAAEKSPPAHILYEAVPPRRPSNSLGILALPLGFVAGVLMSAATVVLRTTLSSKINFSDEVELVTGVPTFASLPELKRRGRKKNPEPDGSADPMATETFRALWLHLRSAANQGGSVVLVTSSEVDEGKTTIATEFARQIAADGFNVLLIDADLRRPRLAENLGMNSETSLESVLAGTVAVDEAARYDPTGRFRCLTADGRAANPVGLLSSSQFSSLILACRQSYDLVILDSPPVLHVVDPVVLAGCASKILFLVAASRVPRDLVGEAMARFPAGDRAKMFTLFTRVPRKQLDRGDSYSGYPPILQIAGAG